MNCRLEICCSRALNRRLSDIRVASGDADSDGVGWSSVADFELKRPQDHYIQDLALLCYFQESLSKKLCEQVARWILGFAVRLDFRAWLIC